MSEQGPRQSSETEAPPPMPEPSLHYIVQTFALQALIWTGHVPNPADEKAEPNLDLAKFQIGLLEVLERKTQGNREASEDEFLTEMLHNCRMAFIRARDALSARPEAPESAPEKAGTEKPEEPEEKETEKQPRETAEEQEGETESEEEKKAEKEPNG